jgi:hypothetical protein
VTPGKPGLALTIVNALAKKGKAKHDPMAGLADADEAPDSSKGDDGAEHLKEVASDMLKAIKDDDADALADLLREAYECCETYSADEG